MDKPREIKAYPFNEEAEKSLLAAYLIDADAARDIPELRETDFFLSEHKKVFSAMYALAADNKNVDIVTVFDTLKKKGELDISLKYLSDLADSIPSAANHRNYRAIIERDSLLRKLLDASKAISEDAYTSVDAEKSIANAEGLILGLAKEREKKRLLPVGPITNDVIKRIEATASNKEALRGLDTGFSLLNSWTNGLQKSDLILLAARPSIGKTAFALNIAVNVTKKFPEKKVAVFSVEMPSVQIVQRMLCQLGRVSMESANKGTLNSEAYRNLFDARKLLAQGGIYIDDSSSITPAEVLSKCRRFVAEQGRLDLIILDYLQLMESDSHHESRQLDVGDISRKMKRVARELDVPLVLLSQLSRAVEMRGDKPQLSDLRDSGAIEQDADIVTFLHRDKTKQDMRIELIIAKHRNGRVGSIFFDWEGDTVSFRESADQEQRQIAKPENAKSGKPQIAQ